MNDVIKHKDFIGSVHFASEDNIFYGKIEGINDLVTFEGTSVKEIKEAFIKAADDYIEICKATGKKIFKSYKGSFNIRISPELHRKAVNESIIKGISLNQFVQKAIEDELANSN